MQPDNCLNCGVPIAPGNRFCPQCGQKTGTHRLSLHEVGHDLIHYFTHADKGIFSLIRELAVKPGRAAREFVEGKRKKYFPPLNFVLIVAGLCLVITAITYPYKTQGPRRAVSPRQAQTAATYSPEQLKRWGNVGKFFAKYSNLVTIAAVPLLSLVCWLFYIRGRYNYTEHLVANMYLAGFVLLGYALIIKPAELLPAVNRGFVLIALYFLFEIIYRAVFYYYFMNRKTVAAAIKSVLVSMALVAFWAVLVNLIITLYRDHGFWGLLA